MKSSYTLRPGRLLRILGRKGDGPGEFRLSETVLIGESDSVLIFDGLARRVTLLSPSLQVVRTSQSIRVEQAVRLSNGRIVAEARLPTPNAFGFPLHALDPAGAVITSFGADRAATVQMNPGISSYRRIARATSESVWSAYIDRYEIEEWSWSGQRLRLVVRGAPWFDKRDAEPDGPPDVTKPKPSIRSLHATHDGRLWVLASVARNDWKRHQPEVVNSVRLSLLPSNQDRYTDSVLELLDPRDGTINVTARFRLALSGFVGPETVYAHRESAEGDEVVEIFRVRMRRP